MSDAVCLQKIAVRLNADDIDSDTHARTETAEIGDADYEDSEVDENEAGDDELDEESDDDEENDSDIDDDTDAEINAEATESEAAREADIAVKLQALVKQPIAILKRWNRNNRVAEEQLFNTFDEMCDLFDRDLGGLPRFPLHTLYDAHKRRHHRACAHGRRAGRVSVPPYG
jgi:hypothetical protein